MKILFQSYALYPSVGGIESSAALFLREFENAGCELRVHTATELGEHPELETFPIKRKPSIAERWRDSQWADVIYQHNPSLQLVWPALFSRTPKVVSVRTWIRRADTERVSAVDRIKKFWIGQQTVICNSEATAEQLHCPSTVIENAYDDSTFRLTHETDERRGLIFVGRLVKDKGCHTLIEALAQLNAGGHNLPLTIIGEGPERAALEAQAATLGLSRQITFTGRQAPASVASSLNEHKYHIIPSRWAEPFGIVALEGIACGCLPIGTNRGGLVDAIGPCGPLVEPDNPEAIAKAVETLEKRPESYEEYLRQHESHLDEHRPSIVAQRYLTLFEKARRT